MLAILLVSLLLHFVYGVEYTLTAGPLRKGASWTGTHECPPDTFIRALDTSEFKYESPSLDDDLGVIHIVFECASVAGTQVAHIGTSVEGVEHRIGGACPPAATNAGRQRIGWVPATPICVNYELPLRVQCPLLATGLQVRVQPVQGTSDDVGLDGVRLRCDTATAAEAFTNAAEGGHWLDEVKCTSRHALCGVQTGALQLDHEELDHYTIESLRVKCCPIPNPVSMCTPVVSWNKVVHTWRTDTINVMCPWVGPLWIGIEENAAHDGDEQLREVYGMLGFNVSTAIPPLYKKVIVMPPENEFEWADAAARTWNLASPYVLEPFPCGGQVRDFKTVIMHQLVAKCGWYTVRTGHFRRTDITRNENGDLVNEATSYFGN